ncbi:MAG: L-rhamnose isomerase [Brevinema sp.]
MSELIKNFEYACAVYEKFGVNVKEAINKAKSVPISIHCWQGDDVQGFENPDMPLTGGIQTTGNYPGKAKTIQQLREDLEIVLKNVPGTKRLNLHAIYLDSEKTIDRSEIEPKYFSSWVEWGKQQNLHGLDFNPTLFSHELTKDGFSLSHPSREIRDYWIKHCQASRKIGQYFAQQFNTDTVTNIWIPDGMKDIPYDRKMYRTLLEDSLDQVLAQPSSTPLHWDCVESKLFGIGSESYVVGSHEFYLCYTMKKQMALCLDMGHFHPTENIADKISAISLFLPRTLLHVSRPVRWDSDHVVILSDEFKEVFTQISRNNLWDSVSVGLDFFDASINRIVAWTVGLRNVQKAVLLALLEPFELLKDIEKQGNYGMRLALTEELKTLPFSAIWDYYCDLNNTPIRDKWIASVDSYEKKVQQQRQ